jgi:hypothetical protein
MSNDNGNGTNGNGKTGNGKRLPQVSGPDPVANLPVMEGFPSSEKTYVEAGEIRVPVRRIHLAGGEPPFDVRRASIHTTGCRSCASPGSTRG